MSQLEPDRSGSLTRLTFPARREEGAGPALEGVALVELDRAHKLNALNTPLIVELVALLERLDADPGCRCIVLAGSSSRAFAAGADIAELAEASPQGLAEGLLFARWDRIRLVKTPLIAAVRGIATGGGCELAMDCDIIVAGSDARFGLPELKLGIMPGAGGTQRLTRAVGKARATELILTGRLIDAAEAKAIGLIGLVVPPEETRGAALDLAAAIASGPPLAVRAALEAIDAALELPLSEGLKVERRAFLGLFATKDQREGMRAFLEKRRPVWVGR